MDPFEKPYWSNFQVELWVCTRSREAVRLADHAPGRTCLADLSIGPDGVDDEAYDQGTPIFKDASGLIGTAITNYGFICPFDDARRDVIVALSKGQLQEHQDRSSGVKFFEREQVLRLWPDPRLETLLAQPEDGAIGDSGATQGYVQTTEPVATGAPGRPTSMHLVEAELDQRIAAGDSWPSKTSAAEELSEWLRLKHKLVPRLTPKTIKNRLGYKLPISAKPTARN